MIYYFGKLKQHFLVVLGSGNAPIDFIFDATVAEYIIGEGVKNFQWIYDETIDAFNDYLIIEVPESNYADFKSAIELDIQANQPVSQGESIIGAITSGLGLIPDLANEFLKGFTALFWDATANSGNGALTTFSYFAFVFLGIAITMAVVKLVLAIIRGSTGA